MSEVLLISTSDIAELVSERVAVVSTWRNRFSEGPNAFPRPVGGTPARPLFDFEAVREWVSRNRPRKDLQAGLLPIRVWSAIRAASGGAIDQFDLVYWLHQELHARKNSLIGIPQGGVTEGLDADAYARQVFGSAAPAEISAIKELVAAASTSELVAISDFALARLSAGFGRAGGDLGAVGSSIAGILSATTRAFTSETAGTVLLYDPACGIGEALIKTVEELHQAGREASVLGTEVNTRVAAIAQIRMSLRDIPASISSADTLSTRQFADRRPDLVIAEPPFGSAWEGIWHPDDPRSRFGFPSARNADLAWVVETAARLQGNARGLVLTKMGALSSGGPDERVRASLVRAGAVETVISLPANLLQYTSIELALWILRAPDQDGAPRTVALIDATEPWGGISADGVRQRITGWLSDPLGDPDDGIPSASVELDEFANAGMDLTPLRWIAQPPWYAEAVDRLEWETEQLDDEMHNFHLNVPPFRALPPAAHFVTVGEMTKTGSIREARLWTGRTGPNDEATADTITSRDFKDSNRWLFSKPPSASDEPGFWTEPGDIVFTTVSRVRAMVDMTGRHRLGNGVHALRLDSPARLDSEYVALCLSARWNDRHQKGTAIKRAKPGDLEIPLLPLDVQRQWVNAFGTLEEAKSATQNLLDLMDSLGQSAQYALRFGQHEDV